MARPGRPPSTTREQWVQAGLDELEAAGVDGLSVEAVARRLGVSKGGFYWAFADRRELLLAVLALWEERFAIDLASRFDAIPDPRERLRRLQRHAAVELEPTVILKLMAAADDPDVAAALTRVANTRVALLTRLFVDLGHTPAQARHRALMSYSGYLGLAQLRAQDPGVLATPRAVNDYLRSLEEVFTPPRAEQ